MAEVQASGSAGEAAASKASGSSFYTAMRLMPREGREAMYAIYRFCREVDDIVDEGIGTRAERHAALDLWREDVVQLFRGTAVPRADFLDGSIRKFGLKQEDFLTVIDGMAMDATEDIVAPDLATLDLYCDRVASAVGRLSVRVFGMDEGPGVALAHSLGRALQLTNILRDLDEDADIGRLYMPREFLDAAGIPISTPRAIIDDPRIDAAARPMAALAHKYYAEAEALMRSRPKGHLRAPRLMGAVYGEILKRMEKVGWAPPRARVKLSKFELLGIVLRVGFLR